MLGKQRAVYLLDRLHIVRRLQVIKVTISTGLTGMPGVPIPRWAEYDSSQWLKQYVTDQLESFKQMMMRNPKFEKGVIRNGTNNNR